LWVKMATNGNHFKVFRVLGTKLRALRQYLLAALSSQAVPFSGTEFSGSTF